MPLIHDTALVLRRSDYSETSQIISMLARDYGKVRMIAKGVRRSTKRRFAVSLDLLEYGNVVFSTKSHRPESLATMTEWKQVKAFSGLRDSLARLHSAQYAGEISDALLAEADPHPGLFDALVGFLEQAQRSDQPLVHLCVYQKNLLSEIGLRPQLSSCLNCRQPIAASSGAGAYFSAGQGGLVCLDCEASFVEKRRLSAALAGALVADRFDDAPAAEIFELFNYYIAYILKRQPKLAKFVTRGS